MSNTKDTEVSNIASGQFHPDENLLSVLDSLRQNISGGKYSKDIQSEILESVEGYVTGKGFQLDPEIVKYLVQGWWVQGAMEKVKSDLEPTDPFVCPLCLQEKIKMRLDEK